MASKSTNFFTRIKENVMGTKEENKAAQERLDAASKRKKEEKETATEDKTKMAKGGSVKKPAAKGAKKPTLAVMIAVGKPKMKSGGMAKTKKKTK